jgi:hypothetical protein
MGERCSDVMAAAVAEIRGLIWKILKSFFRDSTQRRLMMKVQSQSLPLGMSFASPLAVR